MYVHVLYTVQYMRPRKTNITHEMNNYVHHYAILPKVRDQGAGTAYPTGMAKVYRNGLSPRKMLILTK